MSLRLFSYVLVFLLLVASAVFASAQDDSFKSCVQAAGGRDRNQFVQFDHELRVAAAKDDPELLVFLAEYPLRINDDNGTTTIANAATLYRRFHSVFTQEVEGAVLATKPENLICLANGIGYGSGDLWVGVRQRSNSQQYVISSINLKSKGQLGPTGVRFVCRANDQRILIDTVADGALRYRAWKQPHSVTERPDFALSSGTEVIEGTGGCAHRVWSFRNGDHVNSVSELGCSGEVSPPHGATGHLSITTGTRETGEEWCY